MKRILNLFILNVLVTSFGFTQTAQKTTFLNVLNSLAKTNNLELSYSSDLVNLNDSTEFVFSKNLDSCIVQVEKLSRLKIQINNSHLIVLPIPKLIHLSGLVIDSNTKETLPHAHLLIKNDGAGTITNQEGKFDFKISSQMAGNEIQFSFLGYKNGSFKIPNSDIDSVIVELEPKPYTLSDIYILPKGTQAVDFVKKAVKNIKRNYHRSTIQMQAFSRITNYKDSAALQLIEAALLIEDKGISKPIETTRIQIQEIRKSTNYLVPLDKKQGLFVKAMENAFGHMNIIYNSYNNSVRLYNADWWYQPLTNYENFIYEFAGFEWLDSVRVYKIKYIYNILWPDGVRASERKTAESAGYIYINSKDWGIIKTEGWLKLFGEHSKKFTGKQESVIGKSETVYQKINGKYYLKYKSGTTSPNGKIMIYENPDAPENEKIVKENQWAEYLLLITKVITDKKEMDKIRYREKLDRDENLYKTRYPYNSEFWTNYNTLKQNPVEEKFIKEMEWEKSLDIQFEENSSNDAQD